MSDPATRPSRRPPKQRSGLLQAIQSLTAAQQRTAAAAVVVLVSLGTPWYSTQIAFKGGGNKLTNGTMSGITAFSFVEAAVLLVAVAVLALVWARATDKRFSLPLSDGTVVTAAAAWIGVLVVYRLFDKPAGKAENGSATLIGLSWGIFASLFAVGLLLATGLDQRRRDAELRASTAPPREGPVVDPEDLVEPPTGAAAGTGVVTSEGRTAPAPTAGDRGPAPGADGPRSAPADPAAGGAARSAPAAPRWDDEIPAPRWDDQAPAPGWDDESGVPPRPSWPGPDERSRRSAPPAERNPDSRPPSRSWAYDDPELPPPPPAVPPSRRRPTPPRPADPDGAPDDPTRVARRDDRGAAPRPGSPDEPPAPEPGTRIGRRRRRDER